MDFAATADQIRAGKKPDFHDSSLAYAQSLDSADPLRHLREDYVFPTKASLKSKALRQGKYSSRMTCSSGSSPAAET